MMYPFETSDAVCNVLTEYWQLIVSNLFKSFSKIHIQHSIILAMKVSNMQEGPTSHVTHSTLKVDSTESVVAAVSPLSTIPQVRRAFTQQDGKEVYFFEGKMGKAQGNRNKLNKRDSGNKDGIVGSSHGNRPKGISDKSSKVVTNASQIASKEKEYLHPVQNSLESRDFLGVSVSQCCNFPLSPAETTSFPKHYSSHGDRDARNNRGKQKQSEHNHERFQSDLSSADYGNAVSRGKTPDNSSVPNGSGLIKKEDKKMIEISKFENLPSGISAEELNPRELPKLNCREDCGIADTDGFDGEKIDSAKHPGNRVDSGLDSRKNCGLIKVESKIPDDTARRNDRGKYPDDAKREKRLDRRTVENEKCDEGQNQHFYNRYHPNQIFSAGSQKAPDCFSGREETEVNTPSCGTNNVVEYSTKSTLKSFTDSDQVTPLNFPFPKAVPCTQVMVRHPRACSIPHQISMMAPFGITGGWTAATPISADINIAPTPLLATPNNVVFASAAVINNTMSIPTPAMGNNVVNLPVTTMACQHLSPVRVRQSSAFKILNPDTGEVVNRDDLSDRRKAAKPVDVSKAVMYPSSTSFCPHVYQVVHPQGNVAGAGQSGLGVMYQSPSLTGPLGYHSECGERVLGNGEADDKGPRTMVVSPDQMVKCAQMLQQQRMMIKPHYQFMQLQNRIIQPQKPKIGLRKTIFRVKNEPLIASEVIPTLTEMHPSRERMCMDVRYFLQSRPEGRSQLRKVNNVPSVDETFVVSDSQESLSVEGIPDKGSCGILEDSDQMNNPEFSDVFDANDDFYSEKVDVEDSPIAEPALESQPKVSDTEELIKEFVFYSQYPVEYLLRLGVSNVAVLPAEVGSFKVVPSNYAIGNGISRDFTGTKKGQMHPQKIRLFEKSRGDSKWRKDTMSTQRTRELEFLQSPAAQKLGMSREEQFKRTVRGLLNKLTVEKFLTISEKIAELYETLVSVSDVEVMVNLVHDKAVSELDYSDMYADLAFLLKYRFNENLDVGCRSSCFHRSLLNRCQISFEEISKASEPDSDGAVSLNKDWVLGNIRFIGELFLRKIISINILKRISKSLLYLESDLPYTPAEHFVECFTELLTTIGYTVEQIPGGSEMLDKYMSVLSALRKSSSYSIRIGYKIQDLIDLRHKNWQKKLFKEKATSVAQIHLEAHQEELSGGTIHLVQEGKYTIAGLQTDRHYTEFLLHQRQLALQRTDKGVFMGSGDKKLSADTQKSTSCTTNSGSGKDCDADGNTSVVSEILELFLQQPNPSRFALEWRRLNPSTDDAREAFIRMCQKATYAKTFETSIALAELAAFALTHLIDTDKATADLIDLLGESFIARLQDEMLDNPRAVFIFGRLLCTIFKDIPSGRMCLLEKVKLPGDFELAKELATNVVTGLRSCGGQVGFARRVFRRSFHTKFGLDKCAFLDEL